jgi:hypothetical protein
MGMVEGVDLELLGEEEMPWEGWERRRVVDRRPRARAKRTSFVYDWRREVISPISIVFT